ncbi:MAG: GNAT family N-acetyltransferase [Asgard group archaeon]|nr:GNAT family N-acetyltransferase [Asgard group archaeon]
MVEIKIRELQEEDIEPCVEMTITSYPWTAFELKAEGARKFFYDRLNKNRVFVAELKNEIIGFIAIKRDILFANYIRRIVVREDMRGKKVGVKLMKFIEDLTVKEGLPNVFLITTTDNNQAVAFYKRIGYEIIGRIPDFVRKGMDEYILWKSKGSINDFNAYD